MVIASVNIQTLIGQFLKLRREIGWILVGQFLGFVAGFAGIKALTNIMGPTGYGQLALGLTIAGLFNSYLYGPLANVVARFFVVYRERGELGLYFAVLKRFHGASAIAVVLLTLIAAVVSSALWGFEWMLIVSLSSLYGIVSGVNASYISLQSAIRQRKIVALHQGADAWLRIGISIILLMCFGKSGYFSLLGYLLGTLVVTVSQGLFALKNREIAANWNKVGNDADREKSCSREFSRYALSFVGFSVFASISMYADRWLLQGIFGVAAVGMYAAIYQIAASPVNIFFSMVNQLAVPIVFERAGALTTVEQAKSSSALIHQCVILSGCAMLAVTGVAFLFDYQLVRLLTNASFASQSSILWLSIIGLALFNVGQLYTLKGSYCNCPHRYFIPKLLQAVSFLVSGYLAAIKIGIPGVAVGLCISSFVYLVAVLFVNSRINAVIRAGAA